MTAAERQDLIVATLRKERRVTMKSLAAALDCNIRTIHRDIDELSVAGYPIESVRGRYGGGVKLMDWYHPQRTTLCPEQIALLKELAPTLDAAKLPVLASILDQFGPRS